MVATVFVMPNASITGVNTVDSFSSETFALPMMRRFTDHAAIIVKMPESRGGILSSVCRSPVHSPAAMPAANASSRLR